MSLSDKTATYNKAQPETQPPTASPTHLRLFAVSMICLSICSLSLAALYILPPSMIRIPLPNQLVQDEYYKYLIPLLVPITAWFVIANWVGWQYFRFA